MIDTAFVPKLMATFDDPDQHGVHLLFNEWWAHAPQEAIDAYAAVFRDDPELATWARDEWISDPLELDALASMPDGSLGCAYHDWIVANGLEANLAMNYRRLHEWMASDGRLDRMPPALRHAVLRGFQAHDFQHVLTGYDSSGLGEIALQAFSLSQLTFPYFGMWMSVVTTRMTYLQPQTIAPLMDAITDGWQLGRSVDRIALERWEDRLAEPLVDLRAEFGIAADGLAPAA